MKLCDVAATTVLWPTQVCLLCVDSLQEENAALIDVLRYERRKFAKSLDCCNHHHAKERGHRCSQKWKTLSGRSGWFRKGKLLKTG